MLPDDTRHGTNAGYIAHALSDRDYCQPCRDAHRTYKKTIKYKKHNGLLPQHLKVEKAGTVRRVEALLALGHTHSDIARAAGASRNISKNVIIGRYDLVHVAVAEAIKVAYSKLSMTVPQGWRADESRRRAHVMGYLPPLAWDDDDIDDPSRGPGAINDRKDTYLTAYDEVVVLRFLAGDYTLSTTHSEKREIARRWAGTRYQLAKVTGWKVERLLPLLDGAA